MFDYPRTDLPPNVHYIGASVPEPRRWGELEGKRVVLVTQGTIATNHDELIRPAIRALANEDVFVVVTTASKSVDSVGFDALPPNARVAPPERHADPRRGANRIEYTGLCSTRRST